MRYVEAKLAERDQALIYRIYVTDTLQAIANNTGNMGGGVSVNRRYYDIYKDITEPHKEETRTGEEIIEDLRNKMAKLRG